MNSGVTEDAAKIATSFFDSFKSQPLILALVIMNLCLLGLLGYIAHVRSEASQREREGFFHAVEMLTKCGKGD